MRSFATLIVLALLSSTAVFATSPTIFQDDFESGSLGLWTGKYGGGTSGLIVSDPLDPANHAMVFGQRTVNGDAFTVSPFPIGGFAQPVHLEFDYMGLQAGPSSPSVNLGGFIGLSPGLIWTVASGPNQGSILAGTDTSATSGGLGPAGIQLIDDGTWHHYDIDLTPYLTAFTAAHGTNMVHLAVEDWSGSPGPAGDAYFDNIALTVVPEPTSFALLGVGVAGLLLGRRQH